MLIPTIRWKSAFRTGAALLLLALAPPSRAAAQAAPGAVEGVARAAEDGAPLPLLLVRLLPEGGQAAARGVVTDAEGRFRFAAVPAGHYRLQVEQIGYERTQSPVLRVEPGTTVRHDVRGSAAPIQLEALTVTGGRCVTGGELADDPELAAIWNQARTGVATRRAFDLQYRYTRLMRQEVRTRWRIRGTVRDVRVDTTVNEPDSVLAREQRRYARNRAEGYVDGNAIRLPDEKEIVDDAFLVDHCLEPSFEEAEGAYVLRFRPARPRRGGAGLRGAITLDAGTYAIRRLELEYVRGAAPLAWTRVDYEDLPVAGGTLRLPARGSGRIRARGVTSALATEASAEFTYAYEDFARVGVSGDR